MTLGSSLLAGCSPLGAINLLSRGAAGERREGLAYGTHARHRLDLYRPGGTAPAAGWPAVLFFYGGSWNRGEREEYRFVGEALASRGIACAVADYRLYPEVRYPDFLHDGAQALAWLLRETGSLGLDTKRVFVMGHSAGAYNAAMLALDPRWLAATGASPRALAGWVGLAGPYDFLPIQNPEVKPVFHHPNSPADSQPLVHAHAGAPRCFLAAPREDDLVNPLRSTVSLATRLKAAGVAVELMLYPRVNHQLIVAAMAWPLRWLAPVLEDVSGFVLSA